VRPATRCELTTRFVLDHEVVVMQCLGAAGHLGDCTMIDPHTRRPVPVPKSGIKW
jgi:hypothetical protein